MRASKEDVLKNAMNHLIRSWCCYHLFLFSVFCFPFRFPLATIFTITQKKGNSLNEKKGKTRISMQIYSVQTK